MGCNFEDVGTSTFSQRHVS